MRGTVFSRLRLGAKRLLRDQGGNAMMLTAAAMLPVLGIVGSAIDIGRAYMVQLRLQQACDAGVLAGRRAMAGALYSDSAKAEADKMFGLNFPTGNYGSKSVGFSSWGVGASDVAGRATTILPTAIMFIFGKPQFDLGANCTAKLEISNVDVMMVLDVTGSMSSKATSSDSDSKIVALRKAAIDFFDTLTNADVGDGRLRFGVVPYSSSVNVGQILMDKNPDWLANIDPLPSRTPKFVYGPPQTENSTQFTDSATTQDASWTNDGTNSSANTEKKCTALTPSAATTPSPSGAPNYNQTGQYEDAAAATRVTTYNATQVYTYRTYRYTWTNSKCQNQYKNSRFTRTYIATVTETKDVFSEYVYEERRFDVSRTKTTRILEADTGVKGATVSIPWDGCIIERATKPFAANASAPSDAFDMDIDMKPTTVGANAADTQWQLFLPAATYGRTSSAPNTTSADRQNFSQVGGDSAACPVAAMNLTAMTKADKNTFTTYINSLQPKGFTYHDAGMAWGARLISPTGLFADENLPFRGRPVSRHIVFMTDGDMKTPPDNLSHQGQENSMARIGATGSSAAAKETNAIARHNNRFVQLCRAARQRGLTIWVVYFGTGSNANVNSCASSGQAFVASNAAQLNEQFQAIARQISKLRLSQ